MTSLRTAALLAGAWLSFAGCADDDSGSMQHGHDVAPAAAEAEVLQAVTLRFAATVNKEAFACGRSYRDVGSAGSEVTPRDFRFLIERIRLIADDGREVPVVLDARAPWQTPEVALVDFADAEGACASGTAETNLTITGKVPAGNYHGVVFVNGVPEQLNHADPTFAPAPLAQPGLNWSWLGGYRYFIADIVTQAQAAAGMTMTAHAQVAGAGAPRAAGDGGMAVGMGMTAPGFGTLHLGSTACSGNPALGIRCRKSNRTLVKLADFDPHTSTIVADLGALFATSNLVEGALCHGASAACPALFGRLGIDYDTGMPAASQAVFYVK